MKFATATKFVFWLPNYGLDYEILVLTTNSRFGYEIRVQFSVRAGRNVC